MKLLFKTILKHYLKYITKFVLFIRRPTIIVVAGSTNKPFVRDEIKRVLEAAGKSVRANPKNFNTEIGLPLAVLNLPSGYNSYKNWLPIIFKTWAKILSKNFPEFFILMLGTSDPGDIKYLLKIVKPKIAVITDITQRYLEGFSDLDELVGEYEYLVKKLPSQGLLVLNNENNRIKNLSKLTKIKTVTFGVNNKSDFSVAQITKTSQGQLATIEHGDKKKEYEINRFGLHHIYAFMIGLIIKQYVSQEEFQDSK
ncbi:hypothetical protein DRH27_02140 [Candidatus Falkowbacteria bacterium]|nr:MAG: hypothetical protein DRH27_02140 [Candidatus Falkowbacteria bacterium]